MQKKAYITAYDLYHRRRLAYDRLLHAQGKSIKGDDPDACTRIVRQLIAEKKATQDDLKDIMRINQDMHLGHGQNMHGQTSKEDVRQKERVRVRTFDT